MGNRAIRDTVTLALLTPRTPSLRGILASDAGGSGRTTHKYFAQITGSNQSPRFLKSSVMAYAYEGSDSSSVPVNRCYQVKCSKCGKITWAGCGRHADAVMKDVAEEDKCTCSRDEL